MPLLPTIAINKARSCASCTFKIRCFLYIQYHVIARDCTFIKHQVRSGAGASYTGTYNTMWYQVFYVHNALGVREQVLHLHAVSGAPCTYIRWGQAFHIHNAPGKNMCFMHIHQMFQVHTVPGEIMHFKHNIGQDQVLHIHQQVRSLTFKMVHSEAF